MVKKISDGKPYKVVALCLTHFADHDNSELIKKITLDCDAHHIKVVVFTTISDLFSGGINDIGEAKIFELCNPELFDAVVVLSNTFLNEAVLYKLVNDSIKANVPVISIDKLIDGCINIQFDYGDAFERIIRHVIEVHGVKNCGFIAGFKDNEYSEMRLQRYRDMLEEYHLEYREDYVLYGDFWITPTRDAMEAFLASGKPLPDVFFCANDIMAIECIRTFKEHGYRVPQDIIVTGFDGIELEQYYSPRLTTAAYDYDGLKDCIFDAISANVDGKRDTHLRTTNYIHRLGGSCGCVNASTEDVEEKLYQVKFLEDYDADFRQFMYNMIANISNYPAIHFVFSNIHEYIERIIMRDFWICINDSFLNENLDIDYDYLLENHIATKFDDKMKMAHHSDERVPCENVNFNTSELLPDINKVLEEKGYLFINPIQLHGMIVGYMATTFYANVFRFTYYQTFIQDFSHIIEIYLNRANTERLYVFDVLTGIFNRHGFYKKIGELVRRSKKQQLPLSIVSIDMNDLKAINDNYGHAEGDFALKKIAECMKSSINEGEICARFGGDEYLIAVCSDSGEERANELVAEVRNKLKLFNDMGEKPYAVNASFGIFSKVCEENDSLDALIKYADALMYKEKNETKSKRV